MQKIADIVEEVLEHSQEGVVQIKEASDKGVKVIGTYCTFVPWEIIHASGCVSASLCNKSEKAIPAAEERLPRNLCPLIKSSYGHAITDTCPYFHFCNLIIAEDTCDGKRKMFELLNELKPVYTLQIPHRPDTPEALAQMEREFELLRQYLEKFVGHKITDAHIADAIKLRNRERETLLELWKLSESSNPPLTGVEMQAFTDYLQYHFDKGRTIAYMKERIAEIKAAVEAGEDPGNACKKRILITGCPIFGSMKLVKAIEESGGIVVAYENCGGQKELRYTVDESKPVIKALAEKYLAIGCSIMSPNTHRINAIKYLCDLYNVDGVVDMSLTACHTYAIETDTVRRLVHSLGKSYLNVETDYGQSDVGQIATRVGAFLEML